MGKLLDFLTERIIDPDLTNPNSTSPRSVIIVAIVAAHVLPATPDDSLAVAVGLPAIVAVVVSVPITMLVAVVETF